MKYLIALLLLPAFAFADSANDRESGLFVGGGFGMGQGVYNLGNGSTVSKFMTQGWEFEGGLTSKWGDSFGSQIGGEYGQTSGNNSYTSQSSLETGTLKFYAFKAGIFYGPILVGGGYRHNDVNIRSLTISPGSYLETEYTGFTPMAIISYSLDIRKRFRTTVEGQYITGTLNGSAGATGTVKFSETSLSLRLFFLFD